MVVDVALVAQKVLNLFQIFASEQLSDLKHVFKHRGVCSVAEELDE